MDRSSHLRIPDPSSRNRFRFRLFSNLKTGIAWGRQRQRDTPWSPSRMRKEKGETDPHISSDFEERLQEKVDEWLKSLNERIEREDVTRFEVRFLEILRNMLGMGEGEGRFKDRIL